MNKINKIIFYALIALSINNSFTVYCSEQQEKQKQEQETEHLYQGVTLGFKNLDHLLRFKVFLNERDDVLFDIIETDSTQFRVKLDFGKYLNTKEDLEFVFIDLARHLKIKINFIEFIKKI